MVNPKVIYIALLLFFFNSCEEQPLVVNDADLSLSVDTVSFDALESTTYQVPPLMGGSKYLYLGQDSGYIFNYNFIRASKFSNTPYYVSSGKTISTLHDYIDSSIAIDSVKLSLNFVDDSVTSNSLFYLRYFPNVSDSVFSRNNTKKLLSLPLIKQNKKKLVSIKVEEGDSPNFEKASSIINDEITKHFA